MRKTVYALYANHGVLSDLLQIREGCTQPCCTDDEPVMLFGDKDEALSFFSELHTCIQESEDNGYQVTEYSLVEGEDDDVRQLGSSLPHMYVMDEGARINMLYGPFDNGNDIQHALEEIQAVVSADETTTNRYRTVKIVFDVPSGFRGAIAPYSEADMNVIKRNVRK